MDEQEGEAKQTKTGLGGRLKAARTSAGFTQEKAGLALGVKKATVSSWEIENNIPDAITLGKLAKLYGCTSDALLWDDSISIEAIRVAVDYDALNERQRATFKTVMQAFVTEAKTDAEVEDGFRRAALDQGRSPAPQREKFMKPATKNESEEEKE